jgi:nucleotide-binding universal stress UspA family protein
MERPRVLRRDFHLSPLPSGVEDRALPQEMTMNQPMRILIAYDGSSGADAALADLPRAGFPNEVEAIVVSVADVCRWPMSNPEANNTIPELPSVERAHRQALQAVEEAGALAKGASAQLRIRFPTWRLSTECRGDSPAWAIIQKANEWKPNLVIVGSHGRTVLSDLFLGSVSQKVITETSCSVRVARSGTDQGRSTVRIVIGVDGSAGAEAAVRAVAQRSWPAGSEVRLVAALDPMIATALQWVEGGAPDERAWMSKRVDGSVELLRASGMTATTVIKKGDPKKMLPDEARRWNADCVFVGASGLRGIGRLLLGSVSSSVVTRAHRSVEVVRSCQSAADTGSPEENLL